MDLAFGDALGLLNPKAEGIFGSKNAACLVTPLKRSAERGQEQIGPSDRTDLPSVLWPGFGLNPGVSLRFTQKC